MFVQKVYFSSSKNVSFMKQNHTNEFSNSNSEIHTLNSLNNSPFAHLNKTNVFFGSHNLMKLQPTKDSQYYKNELQKYLGIDAEIDENGMLILPRYSQPDEEITFADLGIDEDDMFKHVKEITGEADFSYSSMKSLGNLVKIGGCADFQYSKVESLGKLSSIGGYANFSNSPINSLEKLEMIDGDADFRDTQIESLGELKTIIGDVIVDDDNIEKLIANHKHKITIVGDIVRY